MNYVYGLLAILGWETGKLIYRHVVRPALYEDEMRARRKKNA